MLTLTNIHAGYNSSEVLSGISMQLDKGEVVTLLGRNGMGRQHQEEVVVEQQRQPVQ